MKSTLAIVSAMTLAIASPSFAQSDLLSRYAHWEQRLRDRVNDLLTYPEGANGAAGDVLVSFRIGSDGKPAYIEVARSSGQPMFDRAAVRLVSALGRLGPVPTANPQVGQILLKLSYGDPTSSTAGSMQLHRTDRQEQLSSRQRDIEIISATTKVAQNH